MRILMLTPRFPYPPDRGDTLRSWGVLSGLARRHEVWLACVGQVAPQPAHLAQVRRRCRDLAVFVRSGSARLWRGALGLPGGASLSAGYFDDPRLAQTVEGWSRSVGFDALLTYSSALAPAAQRVRAARRVLDMCDVDSAKWETYARRSPPPLRWFYRLEARRVAALEEEAARSHDVCLLVNQRERRKFLNRVSEALTDVVPTAVNVADYPAASATAAFAPPPEPVIGMVGSMFYPPNVRAVNWFGRHVWPLVRWARPEAHWLIVGSRPVRSVRRWARSPGVTVTGFVPDVRPYLNSIRVYVNAVDGEIGLQSKLVVALAAGRAAVVRPDVAAGIEYGGEPPFLIAEAPEEFAAAVLRLAAEPGLWRELSRRGRAVVAANYRIEQQVQRVEEWLAGGPPAPTDDAVGDDELAAAAGTPAACGRSGVSQVAGT